jgi:hypothetical protein
MAVTSLEALAEALRNGPQPVPALPALGGRIPEERLAVARILLLQRRWGFHSGGWNRLPQGSWGNGRRVPLAWFSFGGVLPPPRDPVALADAVRTSVD